MYGDSWVDYLDPIAYLPDSVLDFFDLDEYKDKSGELEEAKETEVIEQSEGLFSPLYNTKDAYARFGLVVIGLKEGQSLTDSEKKLVEDLNNLSQNEPSGILNSQYIARALDNALLLSRIRIPYRSDEWKRLHDSLLNVVALNSSQPSEIVIAEHKRNSLKAKYEAYKKPVFVGLGVLLLFGSGYYIYNKRK